MVCKICNHNSPDDSIFCQYCGVRFETSVLLQETADLDDDETQVEILNDNILPENNDEDNIDNIIEENSLEIIEQDINNYIEYESKISNDLPLAVNISKSKYSLFFTPFIKHI